MKRRMAPSVAATPYRVDDHIALAEAIALLADRDRRPHDTDRVRKARMREHIGYAVTNGELRETLRRGKKCYAFGRIAAWAQNKWPGRYDDLPSTRDEIRAAMVATGPAATLAARGRNPPTTLVDCQGELTQVWQRVYTLEEQLRVAREEADELRADAAAWQRHCATNRGNARQPRSRR